ncbi:hypothetical protein NZK35_06365 [Stieleria sp. ICT_E10.1]|uniref:hypothetical protein n=1 Tax=Stieleria sedimenti TaxID=2976331 RepID=UPI0021803F5F|nr:hypothetical protein [Stieleria sedimenti]MCS7466298.1 hypothetical protein [Stieleria sedimenti]
MATLQEIEQFSRFAVSRIESDGAHLSISELFDEWNIQNPPKEDGFAIKAAIRDMENGDTGQPFDEFAREFRDRNNLVGE